LAGCNKEGCKCGEIDTSTSKPGELESAFCASDFGRLTIFPPQNARSPAPGTTSSAISLDAETIMISCQYINKNQSENSHRLSI
jgi:hypothetical protein